MSKGVAVPASRDFVDSARSVGYQQGLNRAAEYLRDLGKQFPNTALLMEHLATRVQALK